jgi:hypothetical protein
MMQAITHSSIAVFRLKVVLALAVLVPLGLYSKAYNGPLASWINNDLVGIWYVMAWCLGVAFIWPRFSSWKNALVVFLVTCLLEVLQLSEWYPLEWARSFFVGRLVLGTTFIWMDFFYYILGGLAAWGLLSIWQKKL